MYTTAETRVGGGRVVIRYCPGCRWLARAAWVAQELLQTFEATLTEVAIAPAESGVFQVWLDDECLHDRREVGSFPEPKILKQMIRDRIAPTRDLGHSDR
ncbi:SelT/SelW/SelH family protein [uncultured Salinisphaera sp.]|uniref:SelT/SelW/SelH family protein n=1 Tax=uncultured Salinisphaera sp. TaxID=359372 RepID=UPI0032B2DC3B